MLWFIANRKELTNNVACMKTPGEGERRLLADVFRERLEKVVKIMLDENECLSPHGIRALSRFHKDNPECSGLSPIGLIYTTDFAD